MPVTTMNESQNTNQEANEDAGLVHVKLLVAEMYSGEFNFSEDFNFTTYISSRIPISYPLADQHFIRQEGITIEHYAMHLRINKVKELLVYTDHAIDVIAHKLNYRSAHEMGDELQMQTGLPISFFRQTKQRKEQMALYQAIQNNN